MRWCWIVLLGLIACECGSCVARSHVEAPANSLELKASVVREAQRQSLRIEARNVSKTPVYVCTQPFPSQKEGCPYVYYMGGKLAVVCWALTSVPFSVREDFPSAGAVLRKLEPRHCLRICVDLESPMDEITSWGSLFARSGAYPRGAEGSTVWQVDRLVVIVGYWRSQVGSALLKRRKWLLDELADDNSGARDHAQFSKDFIFAADGVEADNVEKAEFPGIAAGRVIRQRPVVEGVTAFESQNYAVSGPIELPAPLAIRCLDVFD